MLPLRWGKWWLVAGWLLVFSVIMLSVLPGAIDLRGNMSDKTGHMIAYLVLTIWFAGVYNKSRYPWIVIGLIGLGGALELMQGRFFHRSAELVDLFANCVGIAIGILLSLVLLGGWCLRVERLAGAGRK